MERVRVLVRGNVQGVFYRRSCQEQARSAGLSGWVRNRDDGTVEAVLEGAPDAVEAVVGWMRDGPPGAVVTGVRVDRETPEGGSGFRVR